MPRRRQLDRWSRRRRCRRYRLRPTSLRDVRGPRGSGDLGRGAALHDAAVLDDDQPVGQHHRVERVVGDQHGARRCSRRRCRRRSGADRRCACSASSAASGSSSSSRRGLGDERRASATRCAWPPDSRAGPARGVVGEADPVEPVAGPARARPPRSTPRRAQAERDVVQRAQVREEQVVLEHHADAAVLGRDVRAAAVGRRASGRRAAIVPAVSGEQAGERAQRRGLARAVRAEQRDDLAGRDLRGRDRGRSGRGARRDRASRPSRAAAGAGSCRGRRSSSGRAGWPARRPTRASSTRDSTIAAAGFGLERQVDRDRHGAGDAGEAAGERDRRAELAERPGEAEHRAGGDARGDQRQRDPAEIVQRDAPSVAAASS